MHKYNRKDLYELFPDDLGLIYKMLQPLHDDGFTINLRQGETDIGIFYGNISWKYGQKLTILSN